MRARPMPSIVVPGTLALLVLLTASLACAGPKATNDDIERGKDAYAELLAAHDLNRSDVDHVEIRVQKEARRLQLVVNEDIELMDVGIGLGWEPEGDKEVEGDGRTPVGTYRIVTRHRSQFHLFLGIDYPGEDDVARGLEDERISKAAARKVLDALEAGKKPSWTTPLGGAIGVHGGGGTVDWTAGCVAVDDDEIEIIYAAAKKGTTVVIEE